MEKGFWEYLSLIPLGIYLLGWSVLVHQGSRTSARVGYALGLAFVVLVLYLSRERLDDGD